MYLLNFFKSLAFPERITIITTGLVLMGFGYKVGYYNASELSTLFILQYFSVTDLIYTSLKLFFVFVIILLCFNRVLVINEGEKNIYKFSFVLFLGCIVIIYFTEYMMVFITITIAIFLGLLYFHNNAKAALLFLITYVFVVPYLTGSFYYHYDLNHDRLPSALLDSSNENKNADWRIIDKIGDKSLLINMKNPEEYKVVTLENLKGINK